MLVQRQPKGSPNSVGGQFRSHQNTAPDIVLGGVEPETAIFEPQTVRLPSGGQLLHETTAYRIGGCTVVFGAEPTPGIQTIDRNPYHIAHIDPESEEGQEVALTYMAALTALSADRTECSPCAKTGRTSCLLCENRMTDQNRQHINNITDLYGTSNNTLADAVTSELSIDITPAPHHGVAH